MIVDDVLYLSGWKNPLKPPMETHICISPESSCLLL